MPNLTLAFVGAFLAAALPGGALVRALRRLGAKQTVSLDAPQTHTAKQGTPTMGGLLFLGALTAICLLYLAFAPTRAQDAQTILPILLTTLGFGGIGFFDDYLKVTRGKNLGLKARQKLILQSLIAIGFALWLMRVSQPGLTSAVQVTPYLGGVAHFVDLGAAYYPLVVIFMVGFSNATNLTDGLDGLSGGVSLLISLTLTGLLGVSLAPHLGVFTAALAGGLAGFLWWNAHPAKVFMGDVGALAIGAALAGVAVVGKQEVAVIVASLVCWAEIFSDIIQVSVFKYRRKKHGVEYARAHRVFRRAPLHHHFEECGLAETQVVLRFWLVGAVCGALALLWGRF